MKKITAMNTTDLKCATRAVADKLAFATLLVPGVVWAQKAGSMSETQGEMCGFLNNITSLLNIGSIAAYETSTEHGAAYSAAKAGVLALTRVAAAENGRHGIRVNAVTPGLIYNDFLRKIYPDEFFDGYAESRSLVGRVGQPEDVASLVAFLVSDQAGYVTGEVYGVSGGVYPHG